MMTSFTVIKLIGFLSTSSGFLLATQSPQNPKSINSHHFILNSNWYHFCLFIYFVFLESRLSVSASVMWLCNGLECFSSEVFILDINHGSSKATRQDHHSW
ncbi:hypothetical protein Dsin_006006 [Dipteronia sinensis]|uniref:Secreted protein n=1 Tax=Dipteronia sinensis TaxID=43782 RepID=A0AAE0AYY0_9ROSI|nr:hypothetical protein Dsin_006006 [Dipteronia sinensis]